LPSATGRIIFLIRCYALLLRGRYELNWPARRRKEGITPDALMLARLECGTDRGVEKGEMA